MNDNYNHPLSFTSQFSFCGLPLRLDTYSGCAFNCKYCFSNSRNGNFNNKKIRTISPPKLINKIDNAIKNIKSSSGLLSQCLRHRMPIHFGGMSDPFQPMEMKTKASYHILEYLASIDYPLIISTKSILLQEKNYLNLLSNYKNVIVQISFSTLNPSAAKIVEPNCDSPVARIKLIKKLSDNGIKTMIRWQPFIIGFSESPSEFVKNILNSGAQHLIIEFLKLSIDKKINWNSNNIVLNNINEFYKRNDSNLIGRELILPAKLKLKTIDLLRSELKDSFITLGVADNEIQYFSDTKCCCGIDKYEGFENWHKHQINYAITNSNTDLIKYDIIKREWKPSGAIDKFINSKSRIRKRSTNSLSDYIIDRWQNLDSDFNPTKIFGVIDTGFKDNDGFRIFKSKAKK